MSVKPTCRTYEDLLFSDQLDESSMVLVHYSYDGNEFVRLGWICEDPECHRGKHLVIVEKDDALLVLNDYGVKVLRIITRQALIEVLNSLPVELIK